MWVGTGGEEKGTLELVRFGRCHTGFERRKAHGLASAAAGVRSVQLGVLETGLQHLAPTVPPALHVPRVPWSNRSNALRRASSRLRMNFLKSAKVSSGSPPGESGCCCRPEPALAPAWWPPLWVASTALTKWEAYELGRPFLRANASKSSAVMWPWKEEEGWGAEGHC